ncbi:MAG: hypothetical protein LBB65_06055 [Burkholderiales bacterium]|jgi:hypothetical protein|nr:hypothetical protein [Burkholderiales bacterium]
MSFLKRFLKKQPSAETIPVKAAQEKPAEVIPYPASHISDILCVTEIANAEFFVGNLFRRRFNTPSFPDMPRHFVAFYKIDEKTMLPVGYVHQTPWENCYLCGGLVIDDRRYRLIPAAHRRIIREAGGIAEHLQRESFAAIRDENTLAIWGFVGDKLAEQVDLRVGFVHTDVPYLMAVWLKPLPEEEKAALIQKAAALGGF